MLVWIYTTCMLELKGAALHNPAFQAFVERTRKGARDERRKMLSGMS